MITLFFNTLASHKGCRSEQIQRGAKNQIRNKGVVQLIGEFELVGKSPEEDLSILISFLLTLKPLRLGVGAIK